MACSSAAGPPPATEDGGAPSRCPVFEEPEAVGTIAAAELTETSGLVASRANPGVLWAHNDSGDAPRLFALGRDGTPRAVLRLEGAGAIDWEDLALAPEGDGDALYAGDIGDNAEARPFVTVYRVTEPVLAEAYAELTATATAIELAYDDGRGHDAEALLVDPRTGAIVIVTKTDAGPSIVFVADAPFEPGVRATLHARGALPFGDEGGPLAGNRLVTGASITRDGSLVALRTYTTAFAWPREAGASVAGALSGAPCPLTLAPEIQGETLALLPDGDGFFTTTEGRAAPLSLSRRRR